MEQLLKIGLLIAAWIQLTNATSFVFHELCHSTELTME